jgi:hypothetical protein
MGNIEKGMIHWGNGRWLGVLWGWDLEGEGEDEILWLARLLLFCCWEIYSNMTIRIYFSTDLIRVVEASI